VVVYIVELLQRTTINKTKFIIYADHSEIFSPNNKSKLYHAYEFLVARLFQKCNKKFWLQLAFNSQWHKWQIKISQIMDNVAFTTIGLLS